MVADFGLAAQDVRLVRRVGAVALAVIALAIAFFVFVFPRVDWGAHIHVRVYFTTTGGLREGAPVIVAGREVGKVESIAPVVHGSADTPLAGDEGVVAIVAVDAGFAKQLRRGGDWFVASRGALSAKYVELGPSPPDAAPLADGDAIRGRDPPTLDRVLQHTWDNTTAIARFASELSPEVAQLRAQVDELRTHLDPAAGSVATLVPSIERLGPLIDDAGAIAADARRLRGSIDPARVGKLVERARGVIGEMRGQLDALGADVDKLAAGVAVLRGRVDTKGDALVDKLALVIDRARVISERVDVLLAKIDAVSASLARGEGSLMRLSNDPEFPEDAKELGKIIKRQPWKVVGHPQNK